MVKCNVLHRICVTFQRSLVVSSLVVPNLQMITVCHISGACQNHQETTSMQQLLITHDDDNVVCCMHRQPACCLQEDMSATHKQLLPNVINNSQWPWRTYHHQSLFWVRRLQWLKSLSTLAPWSTHQLKAHLISHVAMPSPRGYAESRQTDLEVKNHHSNQAKVV